MHKALLSALSAAAIFAAATFADRAAAMTVAPLASQTIVEKAAIICAGMGCSPVETKRIQHRKFQPLGYTRPLPQGTLSAPAAPQSTLPAKL
jgi:hypothetical protein